MDLDSDFEFAHKIMCSACCCCCSGPGADTETGETATATESDSELHVSVRIVKEGGKRGDRGVSLNQSTIVSELSSSNATEIVLCEIYYHSGES